MRSAGQRLLQTSAGIGGECGWAGDWQGGVAAAGDWGGSGRPVRVDIFQETRREERQQAALEDKKDHWEQANY